MRERRAMVQDIEVSQGLTLILYVSTLAIQFLKIVKNIDSNINIKMNIKYVDHHDTTCGYPLQTRITQMH